MKVRVPWLWAVVGASFMTLPSIGNATIVSSTPSVSTFVRALPGVPLRETVVTNISEPIDVTIAKIEPADYVHFAQYPDPSQTLAPESVVSHFISPVDADSRARPLSHAIMAPPLPIGLYAIRLASRDRVAIQHLNVGTLGIIANRSVHNGVLMGFDLRTQRQRSDIVLTEYFEDGPKTLTPGPDGLVRFSYPWMGHTDVASPTGTLIVRSSDGSIDVVNYGWSLSAWSPQYVERDRTVYRPGDALLLRGIARDASTQEGNVWIASSASRVNVVYTWLQYHDRVAQTQAVLPLSAATGYYDEGGIFVADTAHSRYELDAGPLTPQVRLGASARFIISALSANGTPASGLRIRYAWHALNAPAVFPLQMRIHASPQDDLQWDEAVTDVNGDAVIAVKARTLSDIELYAYDPDTGAAAANARVKVLPVQDSITVHMPFADISPRCFPIAVTVRDADGVAKARAPVRLEIHRDIAWPTPQPASVRHADMTTSRGGFAIARWCAQQMDKGWYTVTAAEKPSPQPSSGTTISVVQTPNWNRGNTVLMVAPDEAFANSSSVRMTATSTGDGDALVLYGSDFNYSSQRVAFRNGIAHFTLPMLGDLDDFKVSILLGSEWPSASATGTVSARPQRHLLRLRISSDKDTYERRETVAFRIGVFDWRNKPAAARILASGTQATAAGIAAALAKPDNVYHTLYDPQTPNADYVMQFMNEPVPISYLYPTPVPKPTMAPPAHKRSPAPPSPTPTPARSTLAPQTILWQNDLATNRAGWAVVRVRLSRTFNPGLYLFHFIAVTSDVRVGEAYAWIRIK